MSPLQILLAEDNPGDILLVRQALEEYQVQHDLYIVQDGDQALEFLAGMGKPGGVPCPDLDLLDLNLPKIDGPEVLTELRKHPRCSRTPVVVITSSDALKDRERMAEFDIAHYFRKPSDLDAFLRLGAVVRQIVQEEAKTPLQ